MVLYIFNMYHQELQSPLKVGFTSRDTCMCLGYYPLMHIAQLVSQDETMTHQVLLPHLTGASQVLGGVQQV
jgi:hypothetical protein